MAPLARYSHRFKVLEVEDECRRRRNERRRAPLAHSTKSSLSTFRIDGEELLTGRGAASPSILERLHSSQNVRDLSQARPYTQLDSYRLFFARSFVIGGQDALVSIRPLSLVS